MASQPLNSTISVHRRIRSQRNDLRHESVKSITDFGRALVMSVPSEEILRDSTFDATQVAGPTSFAGPLGVGLPVVRFNRAQTTFAAAAEGIAGLNLPIRIGRDKFLEENDTNVGGDLHQDLRNV